MKYLMVNTKWSWRKKERIYEFNEQSSKVQLMNYFYNN